MVKITVKLQARASPCTLPVAAPLPVEGDLQVVENCTIYLDSVDLSWFYFSE